MIRTRRVSSDKQGIRQGFSEQTLGLLTAFLNAQTSTISLDGTTVDVSEAFSAPQQFPGSG